MKYILFVLLSFSISITEAQKIKTDLTYLVHTATKKTDKPPVVILLHGYGSNESDLFDLSNSFDERYYVFSIRAPYKGANVGFAWYDLEFLPNKQLSYNYKQLTESKLKILSFISHACKDYKLDSTKVILLGFSQGAITAYDIALTAPKKIHGVLALSGKMLEETKKMKLDAAHLSKVKFFIGHGFSDNVIDIQEADSVNVLLKSKKILDLTYKTYEMPHAIMGNELIDIKKWLKKQADTEDKKK